MADDFKFERARYGAEESARAVPPPGVAAGAGLEPVHSTSGTEFARALVFGAGAAIVGSLLYAAFTIATHIEIGYVALGVGYLIGKAMMAGSGQKGGRNYQIASAVLTYLAVSMTAVPEILWGVHQKGIKLDHLSGRLIMVLAEYGMASPFLRLRNGLGGLISLFILFIALRAAWRMTSARAVVASHPFAAS